MFYESFINSAKPARKTAKPLIYLLISVLYFLAAVTQSFGAWTPQTIPTTNTLYAVYFVDANVGYAVGAAGTVIKTANGGADGWSSPVVNASLANLNSVYFVDANNGWVAGDDGIYRTINGGASWSLANPPGTISFDHIVFTPDGSTGFAGANNGTLYWSIDSGASWNLNSTFDGSPIVSIEFVDNNNGFLLTENGNVYRTADKGTTWTPLANNPSGINTFFDAGWVDILHGWVVGDGPREVSYTADGGASAWSEYQVSGGIQFHAIHFADTQHGWATDSAGNVRYTSNGGSNWTIVYSSGGNLYDIFIAPGGKVYVVGDPDEIYTEVSLKIVKQAWEIGGTGPLPASFSAPSGARIIFLIYVENPEAPPANDIHILDNLDDSAFDYVEGSLWFGGLAYPAADIDIFNATASPGPGFNATDEIDLNLASACDTVGGGCPGPSVNRITVGMVVGQANSQLNLNGNNIFAIRYEVIMK